jgi:P27 family predicted phage terminase small subunit
MPLRPTWLNEVACGEWDRIAPILFHLGVLTEADGTALAGYCQAFSTWKSAAEDIEANGLTFDTNTGVTHANPACAILSTALNQIKAFSQEFGLTPSARSRMHTGVDEDSDDEMKRLLG